MEQKEYDNNENMIDCYACKHCMCDGVCEVFNKQVPFGANYCNGKYYEVDE